MPGDDLFAAVERNDLPEVRRLLLSGAADIHSGIHRDGAVNILSVAIEKGGGVQMLSEILGIQNIHQSEDKLTLPKERFDLVNHPCDREGLTPLAKAVKLRDHPAVSLLLSCGADVNVISSEGRRPLDYTLENRDPRLTLHLFKNDSLFPKEHSREEVQDFIRSNPELGEFFQARDRVHRVVRSGIFDSELKSWFDGGNKTLTSYFLNSRGESLLYSAGVSRNYDAWGCFVGCDLMYASEEEEKEVYQLMELTPGMFRRALELCFHKIKGSHVFKMVSKSTSFRERGDGNDLLKMIEGFYSWLDREELTSVILEVLQDVKGFQVAFDFGSSDVQRMCFEYSEDVRGMSNDSRNRVYAAALENGDFDYGGIVSNLAHELAHRSISVVFKNNGLPYEDGDSERSEAYDNVVKQVLSHGRWKLLDDVIKRVANYPRSLWGHELIVRVPEMVAKYSLQGNGHQGDDGVARLKTQAPELLKYYTETVIPRFREYVRKTLTGDRITGKALIDYQKLFSSRHQGVVEISEGLGDISFQRHNRLRILKVSSLCLAQSHLRKCFPEREFLFVEWSRFLRCEEAFLDELASRKIGTMAVEWDSGDSPSFCEEETCWSEECPAKRFQEFVEEVILLVKTGLGVLPEVPTIEYSWSFLSEGTKRVVLDKEVAFGGERLMIRELLAAARKEGEKEDECYLEILDVPSIATILDHDGEILVGKDPGLFLQRALRNSFSNDGGRFIERSLSRKCFDFGVYNMQENETYVFLFTNVDEKASLLEVKGIVDEEIGSWDPRNPETKRFYVMNQSETLGRALDAYEEIVDYFDEKDALHNVYLLRIEAGIFLIVEHAYCGKNKETVNPLDTFHPPGDFLTSDVIVNLREKANFNCKRPVVIAGNPGCGKSFFLFRFAKELKEFIPTTWVAVVDLGVFEQQKQFEELEKVPQSEFGDPEKFGNILYEMVMGNGCCPLEKSLFRRFIRSGNKFVLFFDGFDEICPTFKGVVTAMLQTLLVTTEVQIFVTTRKQERRHLERSMNTVAYDLIPLKEVEQIAYLNSYWNYLLLELPKVDRMEKIKSARRNLEEWKSEDDDMDVSETLMNLEDVLSRAKESGLGEGDRFNFQRVASEVIESFGTLSNQDEIFTQNPLHAQMLGHIIFQESFQLRGFDNLGHLYLSFVNFKIDVLAREKVKASGNVSSTTLSSLVRFGATKLLEGYSANVFLRKESYAFEGDALDKMMITGLLVLKGNSHHFVHRTFAEYFFSRWLLRKARREHVTEFWTKRLYFEKEWSTVSMFVEDILKLQSQGISSVPESGHLHKKTLLCPKILQEGLDVISLCFYANIMDFQVESLRFFSKSFEKHAARCLIENKDYFSVPPKGSRLSKTLSRYRKFFVRNELSTPLTFAFFNFAVNRVPLEKCIETFDWIFESVEKWGLLNDIKEQLSYERGLEYFIQGRYGSISKAILSQTKSYNELVVRFLRRNSDLVVEGLREAFLHQREFLRKVAQFDFQTISSLAEMLWESPSSHGPSLPWGEFFYDFWTRGMLEWESDRVKEVWSYIEEKLVQSDLLLAFLRNSGGVSSSNILQTSMTSYQYESFELLWKRAVTMMTYEQSKEWLFGCFDLRDSSSLPVENEYNFYKFLDQLLQERYLTKEEGYRLLLSKNREGWSYLLTFQKDISLDTLLHFQELILRHFPERIGDVMKIVSLVYRALVTWSLKRTASDLDDEMCLIVEREFEGIFSPEERSRMPWLDGSEEEMFKECNEMGGSVFTSELLRSFAVTLHRQVSWECKHIGVELVGGRLAHPEYTNGGRVNILHHVTYLGYSSLLACVCAILLKFLDKEDMERLLFQLDFQGNNVFHISAKRGNLLLWWELYDVARVLFGEDALCRVHSAGNKEGKCLHEVAERFLEDVNVGIEKFTPKEVQ